MTTLAIINPTTLLGQELRQRLDQRTSLWQELRLLATDVDQVGTLAEVRGAAALVRSFDGEALRDVAVAFFCGDMDCNRAALDALPAETTAIVLSPDAKPTAGAPIVAGINLAVADTDRILLSPHPAAVALAHLLYPLRPMGLEEAVGVVVQPASAREQAGLDELFEQTRAILSFRTDQPNSVFGHQLAFNLMPAAAPSGGVVGLLRAVLGEDMPLAVQVLQGGFFHSLAVSLYVRLVTDPGSEALGRALAAHSYLRLVADSEHLGPIEAAAEDRILVGAVSTDPDRSGGYWLWGVMDNLTRGGASNALEIAERVLQAR